MSYLEYAAGERVPGRRSTFPRSWGSPPFEEAARAGWVAANLSADLTIKGRSGEVRALMPGCEVRHGGRTGTITAHHQARLRLLQLRAKAPPWMLDP